MNHNWTLLSDFILLRLWIQNVRQRPKLQQTEDQPSALLQSTKAAGEEEDGNKSEGSQGNRW